MTDRYVVLVSVSTESKLLEAERAVAAVVDVLHVTRGGREGVQTAEISGVNPGDATGKIYHFFPRVFNLSTCDASYRHQDFSKSS